MPIIDGVVEYNLPEWVREKITLEFATLVVEKSRKLFNTRETTLLYSDIKEPPQLLFLFTVTGEGYEIYTELSEKDEEEAIMLSMYMNASSAGFNKAFKYACDELGLEDVKNESPASWYDYDLFIDEIIDRCAEVFFGEDRYEAVYEAEMKKIDLEEDMYSDYDDAIAF